MRLPCGLLAVIVVALSSAGCGESGPKKYPVSGTVTVNGRPTTLVRVQFRHADQSLPGNLKMPVGMTDDTGAFQLSTNGDKDGAVPGAYAVTFEWLSANDLAANDKFGGKFASPAGSRFSATVEAKPNQLPAFDIQVPEATILTKRAPGRVTHFNTSEAVPLLSANRSTGTSIFSAKVSKRLLR